MPVHKVWTTRAGRPVPGYKWGTTGKIYTGPGAAQRAADQEAAARANGYTDDQMPGKRTRSAK